MAADTERFTDAEYPADPYPGATPGHSFVHLDGIGQALRPDPSRATGWHIDGTDLDSWLAGQGAAPLADRLPVLAYGSNRCPSKITWLRTELGLAGPVVVLHAVTEGVAAVWAAGLRRRDGQRPAVLAAAPGVTERHSVWLATEDQLAVLDRCEGRGVRYRLATLRTGRIRIENGEPVAQPLCYLGLPEIRAPLLVGGGARPGPVPCTEVGQLVARNLTGVPALSDGLDAEDVAGSPFR
ncbi:MAG: gamma-glutamylcyclotransferase [Pseudonocardia sp.]|nr:gamma-glutamylcyclotransferase [Pseudonocardia sp.]